MRGSRFIVSKAESAGFTFVELAVVVGIVSLLAAVAVPVWSSWGPNMRLKGAARDIYANFQKAKIEALKNGADVGIVFNTVSFPATGGGYTLFVDDGAGNAANAGNSTLDIGEVVLATVSIPNDCSLVSANFMGSPRTGYNSQGFPTGVRVGDVTVRNSRSRWYQLSLANSGYARLTTSQDGITYH